LRRYETKETRTARDQVNTPPALQRCSYCDELKYIERDDICSECVDRLIRARVARLFSPHTQIDWQERTKRGEWVSETEVHYEQDRLRDADKTLRRFRRIAQAKAIELTAARRPDTLAVEVDQLNREFFEHVSRHPHTLYSVTPRRFEEIVAAILKDMGCSIELTPETRDGGRDILASFNTPLGELLAIVECKRYTPGNMIGIDIVERFLWTIERTDKA
jgi:hypothetical protein